MGDFPVKNVGNVTFSEFHGLSFADLDGDGIPERDRYGLAVLYWHRTVRNPKAEGGAEFVPELIHNRPGAGSHLAVVDLNHDGGTDTVTSTNRGTFIFWNLMHPAKTGAGRK
jgi:hypothetical protein